MASWLRSCASALRRLPRRGIEEFWQGGVRDPLINAAQKQEWAKSGDPWPAVLLRQKSFEDMHKLWYVLLKEKNFLLAEQHEARQNRVRWKHHGRLKKVKLSMKRILTVLTRREIHQQVLRSKEMLLQQTQREELETQRFQLEESMKGLRWKESSDPTRRSTARGTFRGSAEETDRNRDKHGKATGKHRRGRDARWRGDEDVAPKSKPSGCGFERCLSILDMSCPKATLQKYEADHERLLRELVPLRRDTMQSPAWRAKFARKYSDLPGAINWKRQWVRALEDRQWKPVRLPA
ncbi:39S ribosomal protein L47 [Durusdinium trenchii]|uniref:Large ribosomal subunit protein uL29m n=1 Tax=Durusdinium trenchii TaxID=1381693 RepID=A0ABP0PIL3_9DINO